MTIQEPQCPTCKKLKEELLEAKIRIMEVEKVACMYQRFAQEYKAELAKADVQVMKGEPQCKNKLKSGTCVMTDELCPDHCPGVASKPSPEPSDTQYRKDRLESDVIKNKPSPVGDELEKIIYENWCGMDYKECSKNVAKAIRAYLLEGLPKEKDEIIGRPERFGWNACLKEIKERWEK